MVRSPGFEPGIISLEEYHKYCDNKYPCRKYARLQYSLAIKYQHCYRDLSQLPIKSRKNIVKSLICYSKYRGEYDKFKATMKSFDIKWSDNNSSLKAFLHIINNNHNELPGYIKHLNRFLTSNEQLFLKFLAMTGLRPGECAESFNLIIKLHGEGKLSEYYNQQLQCLEHYKFPDLFLRNTKKVFISFVPESIINEMSGALPIAYSKLQTRVRCRGNKLQLKQLRSYHNSYLRKAGVLSELVDILAGRVPKSVFVRHYLAADLQSLGTKVLAIELELLRSLYQ